MQLGLGVLVCRSLHSANPRLVSTLLTQRRSWCVQETIASTSIQRMQDCEGRVSITIDGQCLQGVCILDMQIRLGPQAPGRVDASARHST